LPVGDDPDSMVRKGGAPAFQAVLDAALSPSEALYDMVRGQTGDGTPEKRAALRTRLIEASGRIADRSLAWEYRNVLLERFKTHRSRAAPQGRRWDRRREAFGLPQGMRVPRPLLHAASEQVTSERARILTAILLRHPFLLNDVFQAYNALPMNPTLTRLRDAIEDWAESAETLDSAALMDHLTKTGCEYDVAHVLAETPMPLPGCAAEKAMPAEAESGWWHIFGFLNVEHLREEVALAKADAARNLTPDTQRRLMALSEAFNKVRSGDPDGVGFADA
jgi:DNA primase